MTDVSEALWLGADGGATTAKLHVVEPLSSGRMRLGGRSVREDWAGVPGFEPVALERQLAEADTPGFDESTLDDAERAEGQAWVHTLADLVAQLTFGLRAAPIVLGVCMPGRKTADGRGIAVMRHGPRIPDFCSSLERALAGRQLQLALPLARVSSDGEAAAWGEEVAARGAFGGVGSAYYVGCGTGVAEGLKVDGRFVDVSTLGELWQPPWAIEMDGDRTVEDALSMSGIAAALAARGEESGAYVGEAAKAGSEPARAVLRESARELGRFLARRLGEYELLFGGPLDRIVLGQRSSALFADDDLAAWYRDPIGESLAQALSDDVSHDYLERGAIAAGLIVASSLFEAPAIGVVAQVVGRLGQACDPRTGARSE